MFGTNLCIVNLTHVQSSKYSKVTWGKISGNSLSIHALELLEFGLHNLDTTLYDLDKRFLA